MLKRNHVWKSYISLIIVRLTRCCNEVCFGVVCSINILPTCYSRYISYYCSLVFIIIKLILVTAGHPWQRRRASRIQVPLLLLFISISITPEHPLFVDFRHRICSHPSSPLPPLASTLWAALFPALESLYPSVNSRESRIVADIVLSYKVVLEWSDGVLGYEKSPKLTLPAS